MTLRYLSLFSGIEAASHAWHPLGWECAAVAEIEPWPKKILANRLPGVCNLGDVTKVTEADIAVLGRIDLVVFGSPCQDLSVAGKRKGLAGARSGLFFTALDIVRWARTWGGCRFALWENVPGAFTSNKGADFAAVVDEMAGLEAGSTAVPPKGWGTEGAAVGPEAMVEWAVLDAQWFGVAQRRRRVFALADFGDWANRPPVLLEPEGMRGDSAPSREAGEAVAATLTRGAESGGRGGYAGRRREDDTNIVAVGQQRPVLSSTGDVAHCLNAGGMGRIDYESETMIVQSLPFDTTQVTSATNRSQPKYGDPCHPLAAGAHAPAVVCAFNSDATQTLCSRGDSPGGTAHLVPAVQQGVQVRRLTPRECERLQGFADDHTLIPGIADGPRYKALGNSMAVPVMAWIGRQIDFVWRFW